MKDIATYTIQDWLFNEAEGKFDIDLAESGIQYHHLNDIKITENYDLNYSIDRGKYTLRKTISDQYKVAIENVMITHGSQEALYLLYCSILKENCHVITFSPGWQQSWEVPKSLGAEITILKLDEETGFEISLDDFKNSLQSNTKLVILNSPNNPTGMTISNKTLLEIIRICKKQNIFLINDEEYLTNYHESIVHYGENTAAVSSLSKVYGFPGLRVGWFIGPSNLIEKMINLKRYITVTNSSLCEYLATNILKDSHVHLNEYKELVKKNRPMLEAAIQQCENARLIHAENTPFAYIVFPEDFNSWEFSRGLLKEKKVLVMPGEVFNHHNAIRVSFVRSKEILIEGLNHLVEYYQKKTAKIACHQN